ncbi:MAG: methyltransferase, partial [Bdellovibrionia bacterium]
MKINPNLKRYPLRKRETLQAWDSADELILNHLREIELPNPAKILIVNDQFGALSCALEGSNITTYTDSYVSFKGIQLNSDNRINPLSSLKELEGMFDYVLMRIPKNMSFLEDILCHLSHHLHAGSKVICGYMIKHLAATSFDLLNKYIGETSTSLAQKKARLIFANFQRTPVQSPYPLNVQVQLFEIPLVNHSNLFSREKLDIGTRFLLDHIPHGNYKTILDLGCANGIIGIAAKKLNPSAKIIFSDESNMAIQSARTNYGNIFQDQAQFQWINCYENQEPGEVDLVLCNPP